MKWIRGWEEKKKRHSTNTETYLVGCFQMNNQLQCSTLNDQCFECWQNWLQRSQGVQTCCSRLAHNGRHWDGFDNSRALLSGIWRDTTDIKNCGLVSDASSLGGGDDRCGLSISRGHQLEYGAGWQGTLCLGSDRKKNYANYLERHLVPAWGVFFVLFFKNTTDILPELIGREGSWKPGQWQLMSALVWFEPQTSSCQGWKSASIGEGLKSFHLNYLIVMTMNNVGVG